MYRARDCVRATRARCVCRTAATLGAAVLNSSPVESMAVKSRFFIKLNPQPSYQHAQFRTGSFSSATIVLMTPSRPPRRGRDFSQELADKGWYHSFELPDGTRFEGHNTLEILNGRYRRFPIPHDLHGK